MPVAPAPTPLSRSLAGRIGTRLEIEPDEQWKDDLRKQIKQSLRRRIEDAQAVRDSILNSQPSESSRRRALFEYEKTMSAIRALEQEQFNHQLRAEISERKWALNVVDSNSPDVVRQQQWILDNIHKAEDERIPFNSADASQNAAGALSGSSQQVGDGERGSEMFEDSSEEFVDAGSDESGESEEEHDEEEEEDPRYRQSRPPSRPNASPPRGGSQSYVTGAAPQHQSSGSHTPTWRPYPRPAEPSSSSRTLAHANGQIYSAKPDPHPRRDTVNNNGSTSSGTGLHHAGSLNSHQFRGRSVAPQTPRGVERPPTQTHDRIALNIPSRERQTSSSVSPHDQSSPLSHLTVPPQAIPGARPPPSAGSMRSQTSASPNSRAIYGPSLSPGDIPPRSIAIPHGHTRPNEDPWVASWGSSLHSRRPADLSMHRRHNSKGDSQLPTTDGEYSDESGVVGQLDDRQNAHSFRSVDFEIISLREAEAHRKVEEATRKEEEANKKEEEARRLEENARQSLEEATRLGADARQAEASAKMREAAAQTKEAEATRKDAEAKKREADAQKREAEAQRKEQEARRREQEAQRKEEQARQKEEDALRKEEEAQRREELWQKEVDARKREEDARQLETVTLQEEEVRRKERGARRKEEHKRKKREIERKKVELRKREAELLLEEEATRLEQEEMVRLAQEEAARPAREATRLAQEATRLAQEAARLAQEATRLAQEAARLAQEATRQTEEAVNADEANRVEEFARRALETEYAGAERERQTEGPGRTGSEAPEEQQRLEVERQREQERLRWEREEQIRLDKELSLQERERLDGEALLEQERLHVDAQERGAIRIREEQLRAVEEGRLKHFEDQRRKAAEQHRQQQQQQQDELKQRAKEEQEREFQRREARYQRMLEYERQNNIDASNSWTSHRPNPVSRGNN
jgi:hypothetical protein